MAVLPRPTFRLDLKFLVRKADGTSELVWMHYPDDFSARSVVCALAAATEAACEEVRRISKRPPYDLLAHLGADYHLVNVKFERVDVGDEDHDAISGRDYQGGRTSLGRNPDKGPC